jgi:very-short-patch-repair endonuclease
VEIDFAELEARHRKSRHLATARLFFCSLPPLRGKGRGWGVCFGADNDNWTRTIAAETNDRGRTKMTLAQARSMRRRMTEAERALWALLRRRQLAGHRFRRQQRIGPFIADFVCLECRLIVELDGEVHDHANRVVADMQRDAWIKSQDFQIVRIPNGMVLNDPQAVLDLIARHLTAVNVSSHPPSPTLPPQGGKGAILR